MASKSSFHESEQVNCESDICNQNQNWCVIFNGYKARKTFHELSIKLHSSRLSNRARVMQVNSIRFAFEGDWNSIRKSQEEKNCVAVKQVCICLNVYWISLRGFASSVASMRAHLQESFSCINCDSLFPTVMTKGKHWENVDYLEIVRVTSAGGRSPFSTNSKITKELKYFSFFISKVKSYYLYDDENEL